MAARLRPYKDFLTPALHRRFTNAALVALLACWLESAWISDSSWLWRWSPLGFTGIRTLLLFVPCLAVFIIRVANLHTGKQTATSPFETFYKSIRSFSFWHTLGWYAFSAWLFGEIYIWTRAEHASLGWVDYGRVDERPRLNENPIQLRCFLLVLAVCQTAKHFARALDQVEEPQKRRADTQSRVPQYLQRILDCKATMLASVVNLTVLSTLFGFVSYYAAMRSTAWSWAYPIGRTLFHELPKHSRPSGIIHVAKQMRALLSAELQLALLWEISNTAFSFSVSEAPLKRGQPLTSEIKDAQGNMISRSQDPNASLISGLNSKKELVKAFAFWELWEICSNYEARRKTIFTEGDRKEDSTWSKVCQSCLSEVEAIKDRIKKSQQLGVQANTNTPEQQRDLIVQQQEAPIGLPKIANQGIQSGDVWQKQQNGGLVHNAGTIAKKFGQSPGAENPFTPRARKMLEYGTDRFLSPEHRAQFSRQKLHRDADGLMLQFIRSPVGIPFREPFARKACAVVFGMPYSCKLNIIHAVRSLTRLAIFSLQEDRYGRAAPDVAVMIRSYTSAIQEVQRFITTLPPSWSDVDFVEGKDREVEEVREVVDVLKECLGEALARFAEYASSIRLSTRELREAKEAAGKGRDMVQV
ncbi:hypothetical protein K431DRAFT_287491 [Polychaeton citri CBS 116435]|uniref:Nuclear envelope protein n=1 Tax=Polychaeton citri CBS 116435 TaxID=1314669 RepID=A0A9P4Q112_9PEZI|nr:hypothetical protein K431DRAFT_287491 [Polychaeton citri CBS 116435]